MLAKAKVGNRTVAVRWPEKRGNVEGKPEKTGLSVMLVVSFLMQITLVRKVGNHVTGATTKKGGTTICAVSARYRLDLE